MRLPEKRFQREEPANLRQAYHSHEESLLPAQSFFTRTSTGETRTRTQFGPKTKIKSRNGKTKESGFSLKDKKSKFLLKSDLRSRSTNFKPSLIKRSIQELIGIIDSQRLEIDHTIPLQEEQPEPNRDLRETRIKSLHEMEELKRVQELRIDEFSRRRLIENQDTINDLTARIQELQNEVNCTNDSRDF